MKGKTAFVFLMAAGLFAMNPANVHAEGISLALSGGISSSLGEAQNTTEDDISEALDQAVKNNYTGLCIAQVTDYVNVRTEANEESEVVGKLFNNSVGTVDGYDNGWYQITSGNVTGYVKAEYVAIGTDAETLAEEVGTRVATVTTETLRVREDATTDSAILGLVPMSEELTVTDETDGFVKVSIEEGDRMGFQRLC